MRYKILVRFLNCSAKYTAISFLLLTGCESAFTNEGAPALVTVHSAPTGVYAAAGSKKGTILIHWDFVREASPYHIYTSMTPGVENNKFRSKMKMIKAPFLFSGLTSGKTYYFAITAASGSQESPMSMEVSATAP